MLTPADRASRLRQTLRSLLTSCQHYLEELLSVRRLLKGSVYNLQTRCGKPSCHCASDAGPRHSSIVLSWSERGKTRLRVLPPGERLRLRQLTEHYRRFRQARAQLVRLHRQIVSHIDRLEKTLRLPPPQRMRRKRNR